MTNDRRGFTLVELIVVSVLGAFVLGAILQVLITNQRTYTAQSAVIQGQQSSRMSLDVLFNELREVSASGGDILTMNSNGIEVRLMRKFGIVCETDLFSLTPWLKVLNHSGQLFADGDSVFLFADNNDRTPDDDTWIAAEITGVDATETCLSGQPATELDFAAQDLLFLADTVRVGAAVRSYEHFTFGLTELFGDYYLGRNGMPIAGPLQSTNGLQFTYRDALGAVTTTATDVRQIEVLVRTGSEVRNSLNEPVSDSITAWIYTRN